MTKKILIVDDDESLTKVFALRFKSAGFEADTAANGVLGLEKLKNDKFDLVLLDIQMPEMNGFEMAETMAKEDAFCKIPILFMTGKVDVENSSLPKGDHIGIVIKPCEFDDLVQKINSLTS